MIHKYLLKLRYNNSQSNLSSQLNSRNQLNTSDTSISLKKKPIKQKVLNRNPIKLKKSASSSLLILNPNILYNQKIINNNKNNSQIISNNISSIKKIKIPKKILSNRRYRNKTLDDISFLKDESLLNSKRLKTQKNILTNKIILKEQKKEEQINNIYYKIFPKHVKEKYIEKDKIFNNVYNYYCCNNSEQFEEMIKKENLKRIKLSKSLIKFTLKNEEIKNKIIMLRNKTKFIGGIINYCYPKAFIHKINQKNKQLKEQRDLLHKNYLLPPKEIDLLKKIKNKKMAINLINNSFKIINRKNSILNIKSK